MVGVSTFVIVPARGGSKGIPSKNLRPVNGVPLVARAVTTAHAAASVDRVFVTTDDPEIARIARDAGAELIDRPAELSGDEASSESALLHALDVLDRRGEQVPDIIVMMQCTSPFTVPSDVDGTVALVEQGADCAFTAAPTHAFLWRPGPNGAVAVNHDASTRSRRQDRPQEFVETGAVYAMRTTTFREARHRFFGRASLFEVPANRALEIDEPRDLELAEAMSAQERTERAVVALPEPVSGLVLDFDGVLTDNRVVTLQDGTEAVLCDRSDGLGLELLRRAGVLVMVLSKERNPVVGARCAKLGVECVQGIDDKEPALRTWLAGRGLDPSEIVFVGNDVNDLECLRVAGCGVVVADAHPDAIAVADLVLTRPGGRGAVRELVDLILSQTRGACS